MQLRVENLPCLFGYTLISFCCLVDLDLQASEPTYSGFNCSTIPVSKLPNGCMEWERSPEEKLLGRPAGINDNC